MESYQGLENEHVGREPTFVLAELGPVACPAWSSDGSYTGGKGVSGLRPKPSTATDL
jgi:hypothetical protein